jgi:glycosyltransferase involved in cell wall biosynthesis
VRILLVTSMVPDPEGIGAIPKLAHAQLTGLAERNQVTLVAPYGEEPGQAAAAAALAASGLDARLIDKRHSSRLPRRWWVRAELAANWARSDWPWRVVLGATEMQPVIDAVLATREFDLVAVEDNPLAVLRFPPQLPRVMTEHEAVRAPAADWGRGRLRERPGRALRRLDWRRWDRFLPEVWRGFDLLQVFTAVDAAAVGEAAPELAARVRVDPFGMALPRAADPAREQPGTVLFTGTFSHLPNRDAALWLAREIMPAVRARQPGARLRLVGHEPPPEVLALRGPETEVVADPVSVEPHLEAAAVVLAPVRSGGGMRIKVLEALGHGKAVVATGLGAEGFLGFDPEPPLRVAAGTEGLAAATAELLGDPAGRLALGRRGRRSAERHHSPAAWARRLEAVYAEAIERRRGGRPGTGSGRARIEAT